MYTGLDVLQDDDYSKHPLTRRMYRGLGQDPAMLINAAFTLTTIGQFAIVVLLATLLLSRWVSKRSAVLLNLLVISLLGTIPQYFLMYAGEIFNPTPPAGLCVTQAAFIQGVQVMFAVASLSLVMDLLVESHLIITAATKSRYLSATLVVIPYITFAAVASVASAFGVAHPDQVEHMPEDLACTLHNATFTTAAHIVISVIVALTLSLEAYAIIRIVATRRLLSTWRTLPEDSNLPSFSQAARIAGFTCLQALLLIFSTLLAYVRSDALRIASVLLQSLMPLATFGIFGLTTDCCEAWRRAVPNPFSRRSKTRSAREKQAFRPMEIEVTIEKNGPELLLEFDDKPFHIRFESHIPPC